MFLFSEWLPSLCRVVLFLCVQLFVSTPDLVSISRGKERAIDTFGCWLQLHFETLGCKCVWIQFLSLTFLILPILEGSLFLLVGLTISTLCKISKFLRRQTRHCLNSGVSYRLVALQPDPSLSFVCRAFAGSIQTATLLSSCCPVLQPSRQDQTETAAWLV